MLLAVWWVAACIPLACWSHTSSSLLHSNLRKHCGISVNHLPLQCHAAAVGWEAAPRRGGWADTPQRRWLRMRCCCWTIWGGRQAPAGRLICLMRWYGTTAWPARWSNFFQDLWRRDGVEKCSRHPVARTRCMPIALLAGPSAPAGIVPRWASRLQDGGTPARQVRVHAGRLYAALLLLPSLPLESCRAAAHYQVLSRPAADAG